MSEAAKMPWVTGRPTRAQVEKMMAAFPSINRGDIIQHADIEKAMGEERKSARYRTILSKWRRRVLEERGIFLASELGVGLRAQEPAAQLRTGAGFMKQAARRVTRGLAVTVAVPDAELTPELRAARTKILERTRALASLARDESRFAQAILAPESRSLMPR